MDSPQLWSAAEETLRAVVLPAAGTAAALQIAVCVLTKNPLARLAGGALAVAAGLTAGNLVRGLLDWWPSEQWEWWRGGPGWPVLFPITVAALTGGLLAAAASARIHRAAGLAIRLITAAVCAWCLTEAYPPLSFRGTSMVLCAAMVMNWEAVLAAGRRCFGRMALPAVTVCWGSAAATILIFAHSARFFDIAVLLTATLCGAALVTACWKEDAGALVAAPAVAFPALMLAGTANTFSDVPGEAFALVALAPSVLWILLLPLFRRWSARALAIAAMVAILIPCTVGAIMAARAESLNVDE